MSKRQHHAGDMWDVLKPRTEAQFNGRSRSGVLGHATRLYGGFPAVLEGNIPLFHRFVMNRLLPEPADTCSAQRVTEVIMDPSLMSILRVKTPRISLERITPVSRQS